ncbi:uncharacterized protein [Bemisia tabaci]|uniref:uncharacterized protein n=1 Tax=Bemisia tabaci TaxID=7038 RepID=UPI003B27DC7B
MGQKKEIQFPIIHNSLCLTSSNETPCLLQGNFLILSFVIGAISEEDSTEPAFSDQDNAYSNVTVVVLPDHDQDLNSTSEDTKTQKRGIFGVGYGLGQGTGYYGPSVYAPAAYGIPGGYGHTLGGYAVGHGVKFSGIPGGVYNHAPAPAPFYGFNYGYKLGQPISHGVVKAVTIHQEVPVAVPQPYPVPVEKKVPYPVKVPYAVPVDRPYPVHVPKPYPVTVEKPVPYPVEKPVPYPVKVPVKVPVSHPVPYPVPKPYPVPVSKPVPVPYPQPVYIKKTIPVYIGGSGGGHSYPLPPSSSGSVYPPSSSGSIYPPSSSSSSGWYPPSSSGWYPPSSSGHTPPTKYHNPTYINAMGGFANTAGGLGKYGGISAGSVPYGPVGSYSEHPEVVSTLDGEHSSSSDTSSPNIGAPENYESPSYSDEAHMTQISRSTLLTALALASFVYAEDKTTTKEAEKDGKKQDKRGLFGLGYGYDSYSGYGLGYGHDSFDSFGHGLGSYGSYGSYGSGYGHGHVSHVTTTLTKEVAVPVPVPQPYPVHVEKHVPVPVPVKVAVPVDRPYPVHVPKPYPVAVEKPVPYPVEKPVPYPVHVPVKVPVAHPVPYPVPKPYPVAVEKHVPVPYPQPVYIEKSHGYGHGYGHGSYGSYGSYGHGDFSGLSLHGGYSSYH